ncbi:hypothetical protein [Pandoraea sputorum]|nr:hypothetical protein [Pandoraea sputorum]VVE54482.1 hypothetical protein PSP20601_04912 [Pandoraea sputorum]
MFAPIVYVILTFLALLGLFTPELESLLTNDACVETGMHCAITVGHIFGY